MTITGNAQSGFESMTLNKTFEVLIMGTLVTDGSSSSSSSSSSDETIPETMSDADFAKYHNS